MVFRLDWKGAAVRERIRRAALEATTETTAAAAARARADHPGWTSRTGRMEASIQAEEAREEDGRVVARFGSRGVPYFRAVDGRADSRTLARAAAKEFPSLARRIRDRWRRVRGA